MMAMVDFPVPALTTRAQRSACVKLQLLDKKTRIPIQPHNGEDVFLVFSDHWNSKVLFVFIAQKLPSFKHVFSRNPTHSSPKN